MERRLLIILFTVTGLAALAQIQAPLAVRQFYRGIEQLGHCTNNTELGELEINMTKCFCGNEDSGINLPNDFKHFDFDKESASHSLDILTSDNYVRKLSKYTYEQQILKPTVEVSSYSRQVGALPSFGNKGLNNGYGYIATIVRKKYTFSDGIKSQTKEFIDTVYTLEGINKIRAIFNGNGTSREDDINQLRISAARAYGAGNYAEAYRIFQRIISMDSSDGESYYRLALMTFYGKGCKRNRKEGKNIMIKASNLRPYYFMSKAKMVLKQWNQPNML